LECADLSALWSQVEAAYPKWDQSGDKSPHSKEARDSIQFEPHKRTKKSQFILTLAEAFSVRKVAAADAAGSSAQWAAINVTICG
jgi:hypothetical protein